MHKGWSAPLFFVFAIQMLSSVMMFYIYRTDCFKQLLVSVSCFKRNKHSVSLKNLIFSNWVTRRLLDWCQAMYVQLITERSTKLSSDMRFLPMWYVQPAKPQISLRIHVRAVWSETLLVAWIFYDCLATYWTAFGVSKLKGRLNKLVWVYTCQNATLLEITCRGSNV